MLCFDCHGDFAEIVEFAEKAEVILSNFEWFLAFVSKILIK